MSDSQRTNNSQRPRRISRNPLDEDIYARSIPSLTSPSEPAASHTDTSVTMPIATSPTHAGSSMQRIHQTREVSRRDLSTAMSSAHAGSSIERIDHQHSDSRRNLLSDTSPSHAGSGNDGLRRTRPHRATGHTSNNQKVALDWIMGSLRGLTRCVAEVKRRQEEVAQNQVRLTRSGNRMDIRFNLLSERLDAAAGSANSDPTSTSDTGPMYQHMRTVGEMDEFTTSLLDSSVRQQVITHLTAFGGDTVSTFADRIFGGLFADEITHQLTFYGRRHQGKRGFFDSSLFNVFLEAFNR